MIEEYMTLYKAEPEVAGSLGPNSDVDYSIHPPIPKSIEYIFDGWLGDELLESFPCFIATEDLANAMVAAGLTGFTTDSVLIDVSETFTESGGDRTTLPEFVWLKINNDTSGDLGLTADARLIVSERFRTLFGARVPNMDFEAFNMIRDS